MSDTQVVSAAARQLAARRWGAVGRFGWPMELELRAAELPEPERRRLLDALTPDTPKEQHHEAWRGRRQRHPKSQPRVRSINSGPKADHSGTPFTGEHTVLRRPAIT